MPDEPMPPLPNHRREYVRRREDWVAAAVAAVLRTEGFIVEGDRPPLGGGRSPDFILAIDTVPTALEVTRLFPRAHVQKAEHLVTRIETEVRRLLANAITGVGGQVLVGLSYSASGVASLKRRQMAVAAQQLAAEMGAVFVSLRSKPDTFVEMPSSLPWVIAADLSLVPGPHDGFYIIQKPDEAQQPNLDDILARTIDSKGDQHVGYADRAILALDAMVDDEDDLREAFARSSVPVPWWRVYQVLRSAATLVFERDGKGGVQ